MLSGVSIRSYGNIQVNVDEHRYQLTCQGPGMRIAGVVSGSSSGVVSGDVAGECSSTRTS